MRSPAKAAAIVLLLTVAALPAWEIARAAGPALAPSGAPAPSASPARPDPSPATSPATVPTTAPAKRPPFVEDMLFADVTIGGAAAGRWMVDTGANTSVICQGNPAADRLLKLPTGAVAASPSGTRRVEMGTLSDVRFLGRTVPALPAILLDLRPAAQIMQMPLDGVLGINALPAVYRLDFPNRRLDEGPFPEGTEGLATFPWVRGTLGPSTTAEIDDIPVRLTLDSGKNRVLTVSRAFLTKHRIDFEEQQGGMGFDAAGLGRQQTATIRRLVVLGRTLENVRAQIAERAGAETDGLVGVGLLRDAVVEIDTQKRTVRVRWVR